MIFWSKIRRSRGFGIHSPFAYDLVMNTLRDSNVYSHYAYDSLDAFGQSPYGVTLLRLIVRLIARFNPGEVLVSGDPSGVLARVVEIAGAQLASTGYSPEMVILAGRGDDPGALDVAVRCVNAGGTVLLLDRRRDAQVAEAVKKSMDRGMTFYSRHKFLATGARHLPRQDFELMF